MNELIVTIKDSLGGEYTRRWKESANKLDAIRWTMESPDVPYYVHVDNIIEITIVTK
jgi:hypothetical protein